MVIYKNKNYIERVQFSKATQFTSGANRRNSTQRMMINHAYDLVEQSVSRLVRFKPAVTVLPTNEEWVIAADAARLAQG